MPTPKQNTRMSAAEWKARYAEIAPLYVGGHVQIAKPINWERVRQSEQFSYALGNKRGNVKVPSDPEFAARAFVAFCQGLPALPICET